MGKKLQGFGKLIFYFMGEKRSRKSTEVKGRAREKKNKGAGRESRAR